ncbi:MAG: type II toxin-antitoxin system VapB family antitoxin [Pseudonocardiaceae bacterium]
MSKTLIDLDDELLAQAAEFLGTKTKKETVNGALSEYVKFKLRTSFGERLASGGLPDLGDPELMARAWR